MTNLVSIHAPTRGATRLARTLSRLAWVSIHAPTRGATRRSAIGSLNAGFNSRAHAGRDARFAKLSASGSVFQFTRPRGARPKTVYAKERNPGFNSRAHAGRDLISLYICRSTSVSIHAPTRGATLTCFDFDDSNLFQFTRPRGARQGRRAAGPRRGVSIHAPTRGATIACPLLQAGI